MKNINGEKLILNGKLKQKHDKDFNQVKLVMFSLWFDLEKYTHVHNGINNTLSHK